MVVESNPCSPDTKSDSILSNSNGNRNSRVKSDTQSSASGPKRMIMVSNFLPIISVKDKISGKWSFSWNEESLLLQMKDGFSSGTKVVYIGSLNVEVAVSEQEEVAQKLLQQYSCIPTFLLDDLHEKFYLGFCKGQLWPLFHYSLPLTPRDGDLFDRSLFQAYVCANITFAEKVIEVINPEDDYVWVHDYHLMLLPMFLRKRISQITLGIFIYSPFPSSEIYKALPVRDEILKGLLNADVVGFHTFDYARHFLSCCSRILGLDHELKHGSIGINYYGRTVRIKILPVGVHVGRLQSVMSMPCTLDKVREIQERFKGKKLFLGVDNMEAFKGISMKLLALELLLQRNYYLREKLVLVQIASCARSTGISLEARTEAMSIAERINRKFGSQNYKPVVFIEHSIPFYEKLAFYAVAECCIVNAFREGMNLVPSEYVVCRQGTQQLEKVDGNVNASSFPCTSTLIVSEFVGCSLSLSGTLRVNPWSVEDVAEALHMAYGMSETERRFRHEKHFNYVNSHQLAYWACSIAQDLKKACEDNYDRKCCTLGFGLDVKVVALPSSFYELSIEETVPFYKSATKRAIFLDYDGTIMPEFVRDKSPSAEIVSILNILCSDPKNTVFIVSGRGRSSLGEWFSSCEKLGIAAEHGYFIRWSKTSEWETASLGINGSDWKEVAEPVMKVYTETTNGAYIESKESALVWHHQDADVDFGSCQAKELMDHLESVLIKEPAVVKRGQNIVEVKSPGVSKGSTVDKLLKALVNSGKTPDFLLCIGDDRSDEDMFESIDSITSSTDLFPATQVFSCTVGQKPSKAKYYVNDSEQVVRLLERIAAVSTEENEALEVND